MGGVVQRTPALFSKAKHTGEQACSFRGERGFRPQTNGRRCAKASGVFFSRKKAASLGEIGLFFGGGAWFWGPNPWVALCRLCRGLLFVLREGVEIVLARKGVFRLGKDLFWPRTHGWRCAEASGVFFQGKMWPLGSKVLCLGQVPGRGPGPDPKTSISPKKLLVFYTTATATPRQRPHNRPWKDNSSPAVDLHDIKPALVALGKILLKLFGNFSPQNYSQKARAKCASKRRCLRP